MTEKELFKEIGLIKEEYVAEAEDYKRSIIHNTIFKRTLATAACLVLCVGIYWSVRNVSSNESAADTDFMGIKADNTASEQAVYTGGEHPEFTNKNPDAVQADNANKAEEAVECLPKESTSEQYQYEVSEDIQMVQNEAQKDSVSMAADSTIANVQSAPIEELKDAEQKLLGATGYDFAAIKERLTLYPATLDELRQEEVCIILHGVIDKGKEQWEAFLQSINAAEPAVIDIVQFTIEGDPIITCLHFDGQMFRVIHDNTRDVWAGNGAGISENAYKYLNILQADGQTEAILSQEANLTAEQLHSGEYEIYPLLQYNVE